jgi:hypothetical protein
MNYYYKMTEIQSDTLSGASHFAALEGGSLPIDPHAHPRPVSGGTICNFTWRSCPHWL